MPTESIFGGKFYFQDGTGEYKELGVVSNIEAIELGVVSNIEAIDQVSYTDMNMENEGSFELEIKDKKSIKALKRFFKTKEDRAKEKEYNKKSFREFIKNR